MTFCDSHIHLACCKNLPCFPENTFYRAVSCSHEKIEFYKSEEFFKNFSEPSDVLLAYGLHPQVFFSKEELSGSILFLEELLSKKRISVIGETGFDFFTKEFRENIKMQRKAFEACLSLGIKYNVPLVIHDRKALDILFEYKALLKKVTKVVFHSFAFSSREAKSLLSNGINAYFSFGKQILNGNKKSIECVKLLPFERVLLETDAPYQTLKGEEYTPPEDIIKVYRACSELKNISIEEVSFQMEKNFLDAFL